MELLTPAGGLEQLRYAVHFGADAVYLAGERFGLRERAENFHGVDLPFAVSYAHEHGKKAYIAANALVHEGDLPEFQAYIQTLGEIGADAAIVSDPAAIEMLQEFAPNVAIHLSTQASVVNARTARWYHSLGVKRIVLARELSLGEIAAIRDSVPDSLELEVFVHGAMCIAYSGRCLISNYLVGRDANRGGCTQPCRWRWSLQEETRPGEYFPIEEDGGHSFVLSSADLNMLEHIDDLRRVGVDSLKIEGRVKGAYYVGVVTNAYRRVIDGEPAQRYSSELDTVSHRPYHTGFFYGTPAQSYEGREYTQTCDFVGGVKACTLEGDGCFRISFTLRNRIYRDDVLEVLSPGRDVFEVTCTDLCDVDGIPCAVADHNAHVYSFTSDTPLAPLDILRKRRVNTEIQAGR
ncbi:MAG: U32 family peptidase [Eggerthellaceae bacterium]|nr:U32 family peptidase [Eggerthellaceae bacterium]